MHLLRDPAELRALMAKNCPPELLCDFDPAKWLADPANFALRDGDDLGLAEAGGEWPGPLTVHLFCASRGRQALDTGQAMLDRCFAYGATEIRAEIQQSRRRAVMFVRLLGFRPVGEFERPGLGTFTVFSLRPTALDANHLMARNVA